jgi:hypothetical protein
MFFARRLGEAGYRLGPIVVNRIHPLARRSAGSSGGSETTAGRARRLLRWLGDRDHRGVVEMRRLLPDRSLITLPLLPEAPTDLRSLAHLSKLIDLDPEESVR